MVDYKYSALYGADSIDKQIKIEYDNGIITNADLILESMELQESLCSEQTLRFGCCEASVIKFKILNVFTPLKDKWLTVTQTLAGNVNEPLMIGRYKVYSDKPTADRRYRDIVAYDVMYDIINAEMSDWYNSILPNENSTVTIKEFRTSFISHFGSEQQDEGLINDHMVVKKTIQPEQISGRNIITAICELNGCFGHISRDGKFHYVFLPKNIRGLYPANDLYPSDDLFPRNQITERIGKSLYTSCQYEDYITQNITKLQIRQEENDIGSIVGTGDNCYIIEDNFLVYGKSSKELEEIGKNVLSVISEISFRPYAADCKGNPCLEVGDAIRIPTKYELVESYILKRTLKGIQALKDVYEAEGEEWYSEKVNSVHKSIIQLKGKANILERTIEETKSTIIDVEAGLKSQIAQTAGEIRLEVEDTKNGLESKITQTAGEIRAEVTDTANGLESKITQTAEEIKTEVSKTYETKTDASITTAKLESSITQTAEMIKTEVSETYQTKSDASAATTKLESSITQTAELIKTEVSETYETKTNASETKTALESSITQTATTIQSEVSKTYQTKTDAATTTAKLESSITQTATEIRSEVSDTANGLQTKITQNANGIESCVKKNGVISSINQTSESVTIAANKINLNGTVTANNNVKIGTNGKITAKGANIEGNFQMTGGSIHIETEESTSNIIELKRAGTVVQIGNDGMNASADTRTAVFQYSQIGITNETSNGNLVAQLTDQGKGVSSYGWDSYSDERLKYDVEPMDIHERAAFIYKQSPCRFKYSYDKDGYIRHGLIAQEVVATIGEENWAVCGKSNLIGNEEYFVLNYMELIADLIATVKSQNERILALEEQRDE